MSTNLILMKDVNFQINSITNILSSHFISTAHSSPLLLLDKIFNGMKNELCRVWISMHYGMLGNESFVHLTPFRKKRCNDKKKAVPTHPVVVETAFFER